MPAEKTYNPWDQYRSLAGQERKETMRTVTLAPRANAIVYTPEQVAEAAEALRDTVYPQAVIIEDTPVDTINAARNRANIMRLALAALDPPVKVKAHGIKQSDTEFFPGLTKPRPKPKTKAQKAAEAAAAANGADPQDAPQTDKGTKTAAKK
jgi:hypothetical protein